MYFNVYGEKVSRKRYREMVEAGKNRRELIAAGLTSRRDLMKMGLLTTGGMLVAKSGLEPRRQGLCPVSPPWGADPHCTAGRLTTPFLDPLVVMPLTQRVKSLTPAPTLNPNVAAGEVRAAAFQAPNISLSRFPVVPSVLYNINQRQFTVRQTSDTRLPAQTLWGFDDGSGPRSPGPTYQAFYGTPQLTRHINSLAATTPGK